jgi:hypothetical protein
VSVHVNISLKAADSIGDSVANVLRPLLYYLAQLFDLLTDKSEEHTESSAQS